jgi:hypothetical protein
VYSSGIPHYGAGTQFRIQAVLNNTITRVYGSTVCQISANGKSTVSISASGNPQSGDAVNIDSTLALDSTYFGLGRFTIVAKHPLASDVSSQTPQNLLIKVGTSGVDGSKRVTTADGQYPNENPTAPSFNDSVTAQAHEAKLYAGIIKNDKTNYSTGYFPVGPDYSSHNNDQYVCFVFPLASRSNATINITGTYTSCYIKLPGLTGWLDTMANYPGAGTPTNNGDPCKDGTNHVTFGGNSTANSSNVVVLRIKLTTGQSISSISVS